MTRKALNQWGLDKIKNDAILFGKVADELKISPFSLPRVLACNHKKLTSGGVLKVLRDHLKVKDNDLLVEIQVQSKEAA